MKWEELIFHLKLLTQIMPEEKQLQPQQQKEDQAKEGKPATVKQTAARGISVRIPSLQTLKGDISEYVSRKNLSALDIAAEAAKHPKSATLSAPLMSKRNIFLAAGAFLLILGLATGIWFVFFKEKSATEISSFAPPKPFIPADKQQIITLGTTNSRTRLLESIQNALNSPLRLGSLLYAPVFLETSAEKKFLNVRDFFNVLGINPPANLSQALDESFMFGVFSSLENRPLLILKTHSFGLAFSGMLAWEKNMVRDLSPVLIIKSSTRTGQKFQDKIIDNHDVRILYDQEGKPILIYSVISRQSIAITTDIDSLREIFRRFSSP